jgi:hypothetical protein
MDQNLKTFKVTYTKREIFLCQSIQSTETVLIKAKNILYARLEVHGLPGCWTIVSVKEMKPRIKKVRGESCWKVYDLKDNLKYGTRRECIAEFDSKEDAKLFVMKRAT